MTLPWAILIGAVAAIGIPDLLAQAPTPWNVLATFATTHFEVHDVAYNFSWPIFGVTTVLVWIVLRATRNL